MNIIAWLYIPGQPYSFTMNAVAVVADDDLG